MGKDSTIFSGNIVFSQILSYLDKRQIQQIADSLKSDRYVKGLTSYSHLVVMLYLVYMDLDTLREVTLAFLANAHNFLHLGIDYMVRRSTLSDANKRRSSDFFRRVYEATYAQYHQLLSDSRPVKGVSGSLYILDSTTITLFSEILKGTGRNPKNKKKKGGIKAHTLMSAEADVPFEIKFTAAKVHDNKKMELLYDLDEGDFAAFDMGYVDYYAWEQLTQKGISYVTRLKSTLSFTTIEELKVVGENANDIISDSVVEFSYRKKVERPLTEEELKHRRGRRPKDRIPTVTETVKGKHKARVVLLRLDPAKAESKGKDSIGFVTNNFEISAWTVCEIYRRRWQIETLFKRLKQNFPLIRFIGDNKNALEIQIWCVMLAWLLMLVIKAKTKCILCYSNLKAVIKILLNTNINMEAYLRNPNLLWEARLAESNEAGEGGVEQLTLPFSENFEPSQPILRKKGIRNAPRADKFQI